MDFVVDLYSLKDRYSKNVVINRKIKPYYKRTGLDLGYEKWERRKQNARLKLTIDPIYTQKNVWAEI